MRYVILIVLPIRTQWYHACRVIFISTKVIATSKFILKFSVKPWFLHLLRLRYDYQLNACKSGIISTVLSLPFVWYHSRHRSFKNQVTVIKNVQIWSKNIKGIPSMTWSRGPIIINVIYSEPSWRDLSFETTLVIVALKMTELCMKNCLLGMMPKET